MSEICNEWGKSPERFWRLSAEISSMNGPFLTMLRNMLSELKAVSVAYDRICLSDRLTAENQFRTSCLSEHSTCIYCSILYDSVVHMFSDAEPIQNSEQSQRL